jgi:exodeoxyribonuclease VIII
MPYEIRSAFAKYFKIKAVNWTLLKEMARSPLHYEHRRLNPREDSVGLARGRAVHTAMLEPELFAQEYVVYTGGRRQGNAWEEFEAAYDGYTILKQDEYDKAMFAAKAVRKHPEAASIVKGCKYEKTFQWVDKPTKLKCKCRVDGIGDALFDLKTTGNVDTRIFGNLAARMLYHGQLAFYNDGSKHKGDVYIIAVEAEPPHDVGVFKLGEDELLIGREMYQAFLARVRECTDSGIWPGKYPERQRLSLPRYAYGDDEEGGSYEIVEAVA